MRMEELKVSTTRQGGSTTFNCPLPVNIMDAKIPDDIAALEKCGILHPTVTGPRRNIAAANWFLNQLKRCLLNEAAALMFLEAFVVELRAAFVCLRKLFKHKPQFDSWYKVQQSKMENNKLLKWLLDVRNQSQHEGIFLSEYKLHTVVRHRFTGKVEATVVSPQIRIDRIDGTITIAELREMADMVEILVEEAHKAFFVPTASRSIPIDLSP